MIMDEVQLSDSAFQNRNTFLTLDGSVKYLTIGFNKKDYLHRRFCDLEIVQSDWQTKHRNFILNNYKKHPFFGEVMDHVDLILRKDYRLLVDAVVDSMLVVMKLFEIDTKVIFQSQTDYDRSQRKGDLVLELIRAANADCYLSGYGAKDYMDESSFGSGVELRYNEFVHPEYKQKNSQTFIPGLASLDCLFNIGPTECAALMGKGGK